MKYPIFITSKGRFDPRLAKTIKLLQKYHIPFQLCVEAAEVEEYLQLVSQVLVYPNTGIGEARQFTLDKAREMGVAAFWGVDDDISNIRFLKKIVDPRLMIEAFEERLELDHDAGVIAPQYTNVLWRVEGTEIVNGQCPGLWNLSRVVDGIDYDKRLMVGEELDWAFKYFRAGYNSIISNEFSLDTQVIGKREGKVGGISYADDEMTYSMDILEERWGKAVTRVGNKLRKNWSYLRKTRVA